MIAICIVEATIRGIAEIEIDEKDYEELTTDEIEEEYGDSIKDAINDYEIRNFEVLQVNRRETHNERI